MGNEKLKKESQKHYSLKRGIIFLLIITTVFLSTCVSVYCILFTFFDNLIEPNIFLKKEVILIFLILFCGLEISKCIIIFNFKNLTFLNQLLYIPTMICFSLSVIFKLVEFVGISSLLISSLCLYETMEDLDKNLLFSINVLMTFVSGVFTIFFYVLCVIN